MRIRNLRAVSTIEYSLIVAIVVAALLVAAAIAFRMGVKSESEK